MPELPEVETVKRKLKEHIINQRINKVIINLPKIIQMEKETFAKIITGQTIHDIERKGKWLIFVLDTDYLLVHLRMEGKFFIKKFDEPILKHEHIIFELDNLSLRYNDTRQFGKMHLIKKEVALHSKPLNELGLEPFDDKLDAKYLASKYKRKIAIKKLLLDQTIITGIGNIYADEILFASKLNPNTFGEKLKIKDLENIIKATQDILSKAIIEGGTTIRTYTSLGTEKGVYQNNLMVHQREGETCYICGTTIIREKIGGRSTFSCPKCQK